MTSSSQSSSSAALWPARGAVRRLTLPLPGVPTPFSLRASQQTVVELSAPSQSSQPSQSLHDDFPDFFEPEPVDLARERAAAIQHSAQRNALHALPPPLHPPPPSVSVLAPSSRRSSSPATSAACSASPSSQGAAAVRPFSSSQSAWRAAAADGGSEAPLLRVRPKAVAPPPPPAFRSKYKAAPNKPLLPPTRRPSAPSTAPTPPSPALSALQPSAAAWDPFVCGSALHCGDAVYGAESGDPFRQAVLCGLPALSPAPPSISPLSSLSLVEVGLGLVDGGSAEPSGPSVHSPLPPLLGFTHPGLPPPFNAQLGPAWALPTHGHSAALAHPLFVPPPTFLFQGGFPELPVQHPSPKAATSQRTSASSRRGRKGTAVKRGASPASPMVAQSSSSSASCTPSSPSPLSSATIAQPRPGATRRLRHVLEEQYPPLYDRVRRLTHRHPYKRAEVGRQFVRREMQQIFTAHSHVCVGLNKAQVLDALLDWLQRGLIQKPAALLHEHAQRRRKRKTALRATPPAVAAADSDDQSPPPARPHPIEAVKKPRVELGPAPRAQSRVDQSPAGAALSDGSGWSISSSSSDSCRQDADYVPPKAEETAAGTPSDSGSDSSAWEEDESGEEVRRPRKKKRAVIAVSAHSDRRRVSADVDDCPLTPLAPAPPPAPASPPAIDGTADRSSPLSFERGDFAVVLPELALRKGAAVTVLLQDYVEFAESRAVADSGLEQSLWTAVSVLQEHWPPSGVLSARFHSARLPPSSSSRRWYLLRLHCDDLPAAALGADHTAERSRKRKKSAQPSRRVRAADGCAASLPGTAAAALRAAPSATSATFAEDQRELAALHAHADNVYVRLTRSRNPNSRIHAQQRERAEQQRLLEQRLQAAVAERPFVPAPSHRATAGISETTASPTLAGAKDSSAPAVLDDAVQEADAVRSPALLTLLYSEEETDAALSAEEERSGSGAVLVCRCPFLLASSAYEAALAAEWRVGDFFQQRVLRSPEAAIHVRLGRVVSVAADEAADVRSTQSARRCLRVLWYCTQDVKMDERTQLIGHTHDRAEVTERVYRCHALDLVDHAIARTQPPVPRAGADRVCSAARVPHPLPQLHQQPEAVSPWEISGCALGPPTRFPFMRHAAEAGEGTRRRLSPRLHALLFEAPPPLPQPSAHPTMEQWETAHMHLCFHRLHCDLVGHLYVPQRPTSRGGEEAVDADWREEGGLGDSDSVFAPLSAFRRSFFDLCSMHAEGGVSGWDELRERLEQIADELERTSAAPLRPLSRALHRAVRRTTATVREEAGAQDDTDGGSIALRSLRDLRESWKGSEAEPS